MLGLKLNYVSKKDHRVPQLPADPSLSKIACPVGRLTVM